MNTPIDFTKPAPIANGVTPRDAMPTIALLDGPALAAPLPDVPYLVRELGLVAGGGAPHLLAGYGFSGKTLAVQSMALSLAAARPVWSAYTCRDSRRVVHVDMEQGDRLTRRRYQRLAGAMDVDLTKLGDALAVAIMPRIGLPLAHADRWREIMHGRDLLIVDSLRAAARAGTRTAATYAAGSTCWACSQRIWVAVRS